MQRFFLPVSAKNGSVISITDKNLVHQISVVLRSKVGDSIICLFNDGEEHVVELTSFSKKEIQGNILSSQKNKNESEFQLVLVQALPKSKDKWEFIVQKAVELGVTKFIPLMSSRVTAKYPPLSSRIEKILREASEQSERGKLMEILEPLDISAMKELPKNTFIADSYDKNAPHLLKAVQNISGDRGIIIGPEGGFSEGEVEAFKKMGAQSVSLGKRILRLETATILALGFLNEFFSGI